MELSLELVDAIHQISNDFGRFARREDHEGLPPGINLCCSCPHENTIEFASDVKIQTANFNRNTQDMFERELRDKCLPLLSDNREWTIDVLPKRIPPHSRDYLQYRIRFLPIIPPPGRALCVIL